MELVLCPLPAKFRITRRTAGAGVAAPVPAVAPAPAGPPPFPIARVNDPLPIRNIIRLKFIGPLFYGRFQAAGYQTLQDILNRFQRHTRASNTTWLRNRLTNTRSLNCVNDRGRSAALGRAPHFYRVRRFNYYAFNALVHYARGRMASGHQRRIPLPERPRQARQAFPNVC
jgi:hypothetical protein